MQNDEVQPTRPNRPTASGSAVVVLHCPTCKKRTPHTTQGAKPNQAMGQETQAMTCGICGTMTDVPTADFQANVDAEDHTT